MSYEEEKGFLSDKFEDWGSEPIPNGWSDIDRMIEPDRRKRRPVGFLILPLFLGIIGASVYLFQQNHQNSGRNQYLAEVETLGTHLKPGAEKAQVADLPNQRPESINRLNASATKTQVGKPDYQSGILEEDTKSKLPMDARKGLIAATSPSPKIGSKLNSRSKTGIALSQYGNPEKGTASNLDEEKTEKFNSVNPLVAIGLHATGDSKAADEIENTNYQSTAQPLTTRIAYINSPDLLQTKNSVVHIGTTDMDHVLLPVIWKRNPFPITNEKSPWTFSVGILGGLAPRSIQINQAQASNHIKVQEVGNTTESWFTAGGISFDNKVAPWLRSFASLQFGFFRQTINVVNTRKDPVGFMMTTSDSLSYALTPQWQTEPEKRQQDLIFSTIEFGLNPILFKESQSGPFASVVIWAGISQTNKTSLNSGAIDFDNSREDVALSYRLGYQHVFANRYRAEIFTAGMPDKILASSKGLNIRPQLMGFGLSYLFK